MHHNKYRGLTGALTVLAGPWYLCLSGKITGNLFDAFTSLNCV